MYRFSLDNFENGYAFFRANLTPVSLQNPAAKKRAMMKEIRKTTSLSEYIFTGSCKVLIQYYCQHVRRRKHPGAYDIDNIVKPILDSLTGQDGLLVDDIIIGCSFVNWIDTEGDDYIEVEIESPMPSYHRKDELIFLKSSSGWCLPFSRLLLEKGDLVESMSEQLRIWDSIKTEDDYYKRLFELYIHDFIYFGKVKDKGFDFFDV